MSCFQCKQYIKSHGEQIMYNKYFKDANIAANGPSSHLGCETKTFMSLFITSLLDAFSTALKDS